MDLPAAQQLILPRSAANASVTRKRLRLRRSENDPAAPESAGVTGKREHSRTGGTRVFSPRARTKERRLRAAGDVALRGQRKPIS